MSSTLISCDNSIATAFTEIYQSMQQKIFSFRAVGYSPTKSPAGTSSLMITPGNKKLLGASSLHVVVPKGAIIDRVEFMGFDDFSAGRFDIGLGTFNNPINFPLIAGATAEIANEPIGGIRDFIYGDPTGANDFAVVTQDSFINITTTAVITGFLQVIIYYHTRPIAL